MDRIVIVGAGPVGITAALALHRNGVPVTVLEKEPAPVKDQRAASIHPSTLQMLEKLGVADQIIDRGLISHTYQYHDRVSGKLVAEFDLRQMQDVFKHPFVLQYEQYKFTRDISQEFANRSDFDVRFGWQLADLRQAANHVELDVRGPDGATETLRAPYVIGADGGRSLVRKLTGIDFEGFTYNENFIKIATHFDFGVPHPEYAYRNYFSDPNEWCNLFKVKGDDDKGLWRAIFPTATGETGSLSPSAVEERMQRFFPKSGRYEIAYTGTYSVNQRVAKEFRRGRVLLAGDAAHVNNPIGGMGMNGGIHDAVNLADKLSSVVQGFSDHELLDLYAIQRRHAAVTYVQAQTIANKELLEERDERARSRRLEELRSIAEDPERARQYMRRASLLESLETAESIRI